ncbi:MAG: glycerate kinase [Spirochaetales bacterium]|nr:glycerate kinase [Spirochaetales bacterium]
MDLVKAAKTIMQAALQAGDPAACIRNHLSLNGNELILKPDEARFPLSSSGEMIVVGAGKATALMAQALEDMTSDLQIPLKGLISVKPGHTAPLKHISTIEASHPVPDARGGEAAQKIIQLLHNAGENDIVISLFSGGGSALLSLPVPGISLEDMGKTTEILLGCGAEIAEMNAVRKHISRVKGGNLMRIAYPAFVINLLLSDVLGNKVDVIASGPFVPDDSTFRDARKVCEKYHILDRIPHSVRNHLLKGAAGEVEETPKANDPIFKRNFTRIIGSNSQALFSAKQKAEELGFRTLILSSRIKGEAREFGKTLAGIAREITESGHPVTPPGCIISGGETTVTLTGNGKGGRNQECVLSAVKEISGLKRSLIYCMGTDGTDGPTDAAGAYCTGETYEEGIKKGLESTEYLLRNDSYHYFKKSGHLITTGPTGTNLMDISLILVDGET